MKHHVCGIRLGTLLLAVTPCLCHAAAQDLFELSLEELSRVTVTGSTLTEKSMRDVPASVTVFTRADLQLMAIDSLEDLMNRVPGFQAYRSTESSANLPSSIRGRRVAASNREILVLVNGMKIDGFYSGGVNATLPLLPLDNVARVEFIRGPGSAVYGSNAYTGVINLVTVDAVDEVSLRAGSHDHLEGQWQQHFHAGDLSGNTFVHARRDDGERFDVQDTLRQRQITTDDPYSTLNLQLQLNIGDATRLQFIGGQAHPRDYYTLGNINNDLNQYDLAFAGLMLEQTLRWHDTIDSRLILGSKYARIAPQGTAAALPTGQQVDIKADIRSTERWLTLQNDWQLDDRNSVQFGGEYRHPQITRAEGASNYDLNEVANGDFPLTEYGAFGYRYQVNEKNHMDVLGLYGQWQAEWTSRWSTIAGLRYDTYSQIGGSLSPRLGLLFHADAHNTFKLLSGEAFRAPQAGELYTTNNPVIRGNPDLNPETVHTSEIIWLHHRERGLFSLTYFYNEFSDAIEQAIVNGLRIYRNSPGIEISDGVESELQMELVPGFKLLATATWLLKTPETFFRESRDLYSVSGLYDQDSFYGSLGAYYHSAKQTLVNNGASKQTLDSYVVLDLKAGYRWAPTLRTEVEVLNLLDEAYFTPTQTSRIEDGVPNRTRELRLGIVWNY